MEAVRDIDAVIAEFRAAKRRERARRNWKKPAQPHSFPDARAPKERREFLIYYARVMIREAKARSGGFAFWLLECAADARREAASIDLRPKQGDLFGG